MPRQVQCTCTVCGSIELRPGCSCDFVCTTCKPRSAQVSAHMAVAAAIRVGELRRPSDFRCVDCGGEAAQYDHRDYSKPLEVEPVCRSCNVKRGPAIGSHAHKDSTHPRIVAALSRACYVLCADDQPK